MYPKIGSNHAKAGSLIDVEMVINKVVKWFFWNTKEINLVTKRYKLFSPVMSLLHDFDGKKIQTKTLYQIKHKLQIDWMVIHWKYWKKINGTYPVFLYMCSIKHFKLKFKTQHQVAFYHWETKQSYTLITKMNTKRSGLIFLKVYHCFT